MVAAVHNRMPVILGPEHYQWWLEPNRFEPHFLKTLLRPYPAELMECCRVSKLVNNAKIDTPEYHEPRPSGDEAGIAVAVFVEAGHG
jgi:putative SOS response-associated peptidase YedK